MGAPDGLLGFLVRTVKEGLPPANADVVRDIEQFLYREARLLDDGRFEHWLSLLSDDVHYWLPVMGRRYAADSKALTTLAIPAAGDGAFTNREGLALFDDDKESLRRRVSRLGTGMAWAEDPPSSTCRMVSNVEAYEQACGQYLVYSKLMLYRTRAEAEEDIYVVRREDILAGALGHWKITRRRVELAQNVLSSKNITTFF